jgi:branched-chain amino acid transport system ATP-binding protein
VILAVRELQVFYGAIQALHGVSFDVDKGEIVTLIGANGAGKSTILRTISGLVRARAGQVEFKGVDISRAAAHRIVQMGISQCPEGRRVFANLSVRENLEMGGYTRTGREAIRRSMERVFTHFPRLRERIGQLAGTLSGGEQQMLAMGRALMAQPSLLLLDEPSMGLSPILVREIFTIIRDINQTGTTVLLVEQNAAMALSIAHRGYALETGQVVVAGRAAELAGNPRVRAAYLGDVTDRAGAAPVGPSAHS